MFQRRAFIMTLLLSALLAACGGGDRPTAPSLDLGGPRLDSTAPDGRGDVAIDPDGAISPDGALDLCSGTDCMTPDGGDTTAGGKMGDPCVDGEDCESGLCVETPFGGSVCTQECIEECPDGFTCKGVPLYGADLVFICLPAFWNICEPCLTDEDCDFVDTACVDGGDEGNFCSVICEDDGECPNNFACEADRDQGWCRPVSGSCSCLPDDAGMEEPCETTNEWGSCAGTRVCEGADGWTDCDAPTPAEEICDSADNNCNDVTDEGFPLKGQPCDGDDVDLCEDGTLTCTPDGAGLECVNDDVGDSPELCNGDIDDDCDGQTDEGFSATGDPCDGPDFDLCEDGTWTCTPDGAALECVNDLVGDSPEICNGVDDNCDGDVDEDWPQKDLPCDGPDPDLCATGTWTCNEDGSDIECKNESGAIDEVCDGQDNDCDGEIDEGYDLLGELCDGIDSDLCLNGTWTCAADGLGVVCVNETKVNIPEACNAFDDDCDGEIDEDFPEKGQPCDGTDSDLCENGLWTCASNGEALECNEIFADIVETCNGKDDDCDGQVDEDFADKGLPCDGTDSDLCLNGTWTCKPDGTDLECVDETATDIPEICDYDDNDCDGETDEGYPDLGEICDGGDADLCENGTWTCKPDGDGVECVNEDPVGLVELCNEDDDDCDGLTDEDYPSLGDPCDGTDSDICANGTWTCKPDGDGVECVNEDPVNLVELCNDGDDDCDGDIDETFPNKGQACDGGDSDLCENGTWTCKADGSSTECVNEDPAGITETCNQADDDCDGQVDEDFPTLGEPCDGNDSDLCLYGTYTCKPNGTGVRCVNEDPANVKEKCNGVDDDCDGALDEGFPTLGEACDGADSDLCLNGTYTCNGAGNGVECVNEDPVNIPEVCNGDDDDCDGSTDPENSGGCENYHKDQDNDSYGDANSPPKCFCSATGVYDVFTSNDCYDGNNDAHPNQPAWFKNHRGDGSFDYNCSGSQEKHWTAVAGGCALFQDLCSGVPGWSGSAPACGANGTWKNNCHWVLAWPPCKFDSASRKQECH